MTKPLIAYMVTEEYEGHSCIVFATNSATARREGGYELGIEWEEVASCKRASQFDEYAIHIPTHFEEIISLASIPAKKTRDWHP